MSAIQIILINKEKTFIIGTTYQKHFHFCIVFEQWEQSSNPGGRDAWTKVKKGEDDPFK